jgi:hypothetical protein
MLLHDFALGGKWLLVLGVMIGSIPWTTSEAWR